MEKDFKLISKRGNRKRPKRSTKSRAIYLFYCVEQWCSSTYCTVRIVSRSCPPRFYRWRGPGLGGKKVLGVLLSRGSRSTRDVINTSPSSPFSLSLQYRGVVGGGRMLCVCTCTASIIPNRGKLTDVAALSPRDALETFFSLSLSLENLEVRRGFYWKKI